MEISVPPRSSKYTGGIWKLTMNIVISELCSKANDAKKCRIRRRPAIPITSESTVDLDRTEKNNADFIVVICRYMPIAGDWYQSQIN